MKCEKCGAELKPGCLFCSQCGAEIQMVPDYNILDDEIFLAMEEEERKKEQQEKKEQEKQELDDKKRKKKRNTLIIILGILVAAIVVVTALIVMSNRSKQLNSYDYQMSCAQESYDAAEYDDALGFLKQALSIEGDSTQARILMAKVYIAQKDDEDAIVVLKEVLDLDATNSDAYNLLISIYDSENDYASLIELASGTEDENVLKLFDGYIAEAPTVSIEGGEFDDTFTVSLDAADDATIYYTLDGTDPDKTSEKYDGTEIEISGGKTTLKAIAYDSDDKYSVITKQVYQVDLTAPESATISPESGTYTTLTQITITVPSGAEAYYTTDGTTPTGASTKYEGPFDMPEGNNIVSVIVIKNDLSSSVESRSYIYIPE